MCGNLGKKTYHLCTMFSFEPRALQHEFFQNRLVKKKHQMFDIDEWLQKQHQFFELSLNLYAFLMKNKNKICDKLLKKQCALHASK